jgi:hypothetical protein
MCVSLDLVASGLLLLDGVVGAQERGKIRHHTGRMTSCKLFSIWRKK